LEAAVQMAVERAHCKSLNGLAARVEVQKEHYRNLNGSEVVEVEEELQPVKLDLLHE
jgi:hypothetical protein